MTAPNLQIVVEPDEGPSVVYSLLAPPTKGGDKQGQLSLLLKITNQEPSPVQATSLQLSFANPSAPSVTIPLNLAIGVGSTAVRMFAPSEYVLLPEPAPAEMTLDISCAGFSDPAQTTLPLDFHRSPVAATSYRFPARAEDLSPGEYWRGISATHGGGPGAGQMFGHDLDVVAEDSDGNWSILRDGGEFDQNEHHRAWGKPVYAMAEGVVVDFGDGHPTNPEPNTVDPNVPIEGNHFYIQHGDELMLYAHLQATGLSTNLMSQGAAVEAGDLLGLAGNSGGSSRPHIHVHCIEGTQPWIGTGRPMPFHEIRVLDSTETPVAGPGAQWFDVLHQGLPAVQSLIQPKSRQRWPWTQLFAVDPLSLAISQAIYVKLTLPDPPPLEELRRQIGDVVAGLNRDDRLLVLAEIQKLKTYTAALEEVVVEAGR